MYPPKPFLEKEPVKQGHIAITVFSLMLFALSFVLFFDTQIDFLLQIVFVVLFHELGHFALMKRYGYQNVRMLFLPLMGAFVHGFKESYRQKESLLVVLAGPLPGIILGVVLWILGFEWNSNWMIQTALLLFIVNILNLLPILPMDGGRLLNLLFQEKIELFQVVFSFIISLGLIALGYFTDWYILLVFGFLMGFQVRSLHRRYLIHKGLKDDSVDYKSTYDNLSDRSYHFLKIQVLEHTPGLRRFVESVESDGEEVKQIVASEVRNMLIAPMEQDVTTFQKTLFIFLWVLAIVGPIYLVIQSGFLVQDAI